MPRAIILMEVTNVYAKMVSLEMVPIALVCTKIFDKYCKLEILYNRFTAYFDLIKNVSYFLRIVVMFFL